MKDIELFAQKISGVINSRMSEEYRAEMHIIEKINIGKLYAIIIVNSANNISPSFYLEDFYDKYSSGEYTITELADMLIEEYYNMKDFIIENGTVAAHISEKEWVKERLFLQLINKDKNKDLLSDAVHSDCIGLSQVLYVLLSNDAGSIAKVKVTKSRCVDFGWNEKEILKYALENTMKLFPLELCPIGELISKLLNMAVEYIQMAGNDISGIKEEFMVLTNQNEIYGAEAILYPEVLKQFAEKKGTNLFLIPSSIHEFIIICDNGLYNLKDLEEMLREANSICVARDEILSNNLYYYDYRKHELSVLSEDDNERVIL